ncbi:multidrug efflux system membrane fusion protein [Rhizomicrobium palustre]|uniref:Multidrug efflux system membrane fusion protein n=1 Tax=Rhizomicrobium palustre TaxID=189966 RepID=A0A846MY86_9PROT|nr:efflux RND transporter periplasmic adaptor subunit [Rhizomicrobium palustre]NIK88366.1 multidrug efflux system membrane fusion protein [Rhizomicrobium palustre]
MVSSFVRKHPRILLAGVLAVLVATPVVMTYRASAGPAQAAAQAIPVGTRTIAPRQVQLWAEFSGRLTAVDAAEIRPEVAGRITEIRFKDGQKVNAGDVLLVIDPRPFEAARAKAEADLASAKASAAYARTDLQRAEGLIKANAIARSQYDQRVSADRVAEASVAVAQAALRQAQIDVDHAYVKAPISGRISRPELTLGNLVQAAPNAPLLATIVSDNGIYADFDVDEHTYVDTVRAEADSHEAEQHLPVAMTVQGTNSGGAYHGTIYSFDNKIDSASGTIRARAKFDNKDGSLVPGMFVSVRLGSGSTRAALLVPERAVQSDLNKKFVYVVGRGDKAEMREVKLGASVEGERIVLSGLKTGDRVIVDGVQHVAQGAPVMIEKKLALAR